MTDTTEIDELKAAVEALSAHNRELLGELKVAKMKAKGADINPEDYARLQNELDATKAALDKATKEGSKQIESLNKALSEKDGALQSYLVDNGLNDAMIKAGIRPEMMNAVKAMMKSQAKVVAENGQYSAFIGEQPLVDAVTAFASSDEGKHFVAAPANSGGGATGGNGTGAPAVPKGNLGGDRGDRVNALRNMFPELPA